MVSVWCMGRGASSLLLFLLTMQECFVRGCDALNKRGFARPYVLSEHTLVSIVNTVDWLLYSEPCAQWSPLHGDPTDWLLYSEPCVQWSPIHGDPTDWLLYSEPCVQWSPIHGDPTDWLLYSEPCMCTVVTHPWGPNRLAAIQ